MPIESVDPFRCRVWALHDRLTEHVTEESCKEEIESFLAHGQLVPALGRRVKGDPSYDVEVIYGARRLFVARCIKRRILIDLREMTDREAIVAMDIENRQRADISPYERGLSYAQWLRDGYFTSQGEIARELRISDTRVSRLLKLARLPAVIVAAFSSPIEIREEWGIALSEVLNDEQRRQAVIQAARRIATSGPQPPAREVFRQLLAAAARGRKLRARCRDEVVHDPDGTPLFRIRQQRTALAFLLPIQDISADAVAEIRYAIANVLQQRRGCAEANADLQCERRPLNSLP